MVKKRKICLFVSTEYTAAYAVMGCPSVRPSVCHVPELGVIRGRQDGGHREQLPPATSLAPPWSLCLVFVSISPNGQETARFLVYAVARPDMSGSWIFWCAVNQTVIDCLQLSDTKTYDDENDVNSEKLVHCLFRFMGEYSKLDRVKTMGTRGKINAIWSIDKFTKNGRYMWIWIANKVAKFHAKGLNRSENIPKSFRGATFL